MNWEEFPCNCQYCKHRPPLRPPDLLRHLVAMIEEHFGRPALLSSGARCAAKNSEIGGSTRSKHLEGIAIDFSVPGIPTKDVHFWIDSGFPDKFGLGLYNNHVHLDVREGRARWDFSDEKTKA